MIKFVSEKNELLPKRATSKSAGYDFFAPDDYIVPAHGSCLINTEVSVILPENLVLMCFARSSYGFKYDVVLRNGTGIIDADFYPNNILIKLRNHSDQDLHIKKGDRFAQGIILPFYLTDDDNCSIIREGGIGSTGK